MASLAAGFVIFFVLVLADRPPGWDEASHALQGALIARDVGAGDLLGLLFDTYRQVYWPPLHSWLVGAAFLVVGPSMEAARAVSVLAFVFLVPVLYLVARSVEPRGGTLAGSLAAGMTIACPGIIALAAANLLELTALLAFSLTLLIYCWLERNPGARPESQALLGACAVLTYLAKTNYGVLLLICIALTRLLAARFRLRPLLTRRNLYLVLPVVLFCAIWFAWPPKLISTWTALVNQPYGGEQGRGLAGLLYFPRSIVEISGAIAVLLWAGLAVNWMWRREPGIGFLLVVAFVQLALGEIHHTKIDRHILPVFPPMIVLTGVAGARLWGWLKTSGNADARLALALLSWIAILQAATFGFPHRTPVVQTPSPADDRHGVEVLAYLSAAIREETPSLVLDLSRSWPHPPTVDWHLVSRGLVPVTASGAALDPRQDRLLVRRLAGLRISEGLRTEARRVLERYDAPSSTRTFHAADRLPQSPDEFAAGLDATLRADPPRSIILLEGPPEPTSIPADFVERAIVGEGYRQVSVRNFPAVRVRVTAYRRP
ncbi:MAG TPA: glycosyltransferase family 39 protein [Gemmatimonadota bacterium]|nr:glycosyltransferase family 39 protein [Gemmatimonadota bacterium]